MMMSRDKKHRQGQCINRHCYDGFQEIPNAVFWVSKSVSPPKQSPVNHEASAPARWRNLFKRYRLVAPNEPMSILDHSPEKILVLSASAELSPEWRFAGIEYITSN